MKKSKMDFGTITDRINSIWEEFDIEGLKKSLKESIEETNNDDSIDNPSKKYTIVSGFMYAMLQIAIAMDKSYKNHIKKSDYIFFVDEITMKPAKLNIKMMNKDNPKYLKNLLNCTACFRTIEDISAAFIILKDIKEMAFK